jgi:hypothetical protein
MGCSLRDLRTVVAVMSGHLTTQIDKFMRDSWLDSSCVLNED